MPAPTLTRRKMSALPFDNGDRMDQPTFHRLYQQTPEGLKAELLGGIVYMASPVHAGHAKPDGILAGWLMTYCARTPGTEHYPNGTVILGRKDEPQPDQMLLVRPDHGGRTTLADDVVAGPPELVVEVANSSRARDMHLKPRRYFLGGIPEYLVVLPRRRKVLWLVRGPEEYEPMAPDPADGVWKSREFGGLWLDAEALFRGDRAGVLAALERGLASPEHAAFLARLSAVPA